MVKLIESLATADPQKLAAFRQEHESLIAQYFENNAVHQGFLMTRAIKRGGKVWINIFPDKPVTQKPAETRMGSGKGNPELWVAVVKPGRVMFELSFPDAAQAREAMEKAVQKLPIKARVISREEVI